MPLFIVLCRFEDGFDLTTIGLQLRTTAEQLIKQLGGGSSLEDLWLTTGQYDLVAHVKAPDAGKALAFLMAFSSIGRARTITLTAHDDVAGVVQEAIDAKTNIG